MDEKEMKAVADRRSFLKLAGAGAVGASTAVAGTANKSEAAPKAGDGRDLYRETEHVRKYYELARG